MNREVIKISKRDGLDVNFNVVCKKRDKKKCNAEALQEKLDVVAD